MRRLATRELLRRAALGVPVVGGLLILALLATSITRGGESSPTTTDLAASPTSDTTVPAAEDDTGVVTTGPVVPADPTAPADPSDPAVPAGPPGPVEGGSAGDSGHGDDDAHLDPPLLIPPVAESPPDELLMPPAVEPQPRPRAPMPPVYVTPAGVPATVAPLPVEPPLPVPADSRLPVVPVEPTAPTEPAPEPGHLAAGAPDDLVALLALVDENPAAFDLFLQSLGAGAPAPVPAAEPAENVVSPSAPTFPERLATDSDEPADDSVRAESAEPPVPEPTVPAHQPERGVDEEHEFIVPTEEPAPPAPIEEAEPPQEALCPRLVVALDGFATCEPGAPTTPEPADSELYRDRHDHRDHVFPADADDLADGAPVVLSAEQEAHDLPTEQAGCSDHLLIPTA